MLFPDENFWKKLVSEMQAVQRSSCYSHTWTFWGTTKVYSTALWDVMLHTG